MKVHGVSLLFAISAYERCPSRPSFQKEEGLIATKPCFQKKQCTKKPKIKTWVANVRKSYTFGLVCSFVVQVAIHADGW